MRTGSSAFGGLVFVVGVVWLYFDRDGLTLFLSTVLENGLYVAEALSGQVKDLFDTFVAAIESAFDGLSAHDPADAREARDGRGGNR